MKAFAQDLKEFKYAFLIRIGPLADEYGKPWVYPVVVVSNDGVTATAMGFKSDPDFTPAVITTAIRLVRSLGYTKLLWERKNKVDGDRIVDVSRKSGNATP
jgi:hypothetical protein